MKTYRTLIAALATVLMATVASAQKKPDEIRLSATSEQGAVLVRVPTTPFPYALQFSKDGKSGFMSRVYIMKVASSSAGYAYVARTLAPGRYRLDSVWQQGAWAACLQEGTFEFTVRPGKIAFLGTFEVESVLRAIQAQAVERKKTIVFGTDFMLGQSQASPDVITGRDQADLFDAARFAEITMHGSGELVELADIDAASFAPSGFNKAIKICG